MRVSPEFYRITGDLKDKLQARDLVDTTKHIANFLGDGKSVVVTTRKVNRDKQRTVFELSPARF